MYGRRFNLFTASYQGLAVGGTGCVQGCGAVQTCGAVGGCSQVGTCGAQSAIMGTLYPPLSHTGPSTVYNGYKYAHVPAGGPPMKITPTSYTNPLLATQQPQSLPYRPPPPQLCVGPTSTHAPLRLAARWLTKHFHHKTMRNVSVKHTSLKNSSRKKS